MKLETAAILAAVIVAVAVLLTQHWQISAAGGMVYRLDAWTGTVTLCAPQAAAVGAEAKCKPTQPLP